MTRHRLGLGDFLVLTLPSRRNERRVPPLRDPKLVGALDAPAQQRRQFLPCQSRTVDDDELIVPLSSERRATSKEAALRTKGRTTRRTP